jgi:hypothetical protein
MVFQEQLPVVPCYNVNYDFTNGGTKNTNEKAIIYAG